MSWKWVIDRRSGKLRIDQRALGVAIAGGVVLAVVARAVLPGNWFYVVVAMLTVAGIAVDIWIRKRDPESPPRDG